MKYVLDVLLFLALLLIIQTCQARADTYASGMVGVAGSAKESFSETKFFSLGYRESLPLGFIYQIETGAWFDRYGQGRRNSGFLATQLGIEADGIVLMRMAVGPAIITTPDSYLGGRFPQFSEDLFIGVRGSNGNCIGFKYKHFSSAGIVMPNHGRDFFGLEISVPW